MPTRFVLEGPRVLLRPGQTSDIPAILAFYQENAEHLRPWEPLRTPEFYTEAFWEGRLRQAHDDIVHNRNVHMFLFERSAPERVIGTVNLNGIIPGVAWYCNMGYSLAADREGHGFMREAVELAIEHAFHGRPNLHRIQANYMPHNRRSGGLLRRLGFVVEGYARDYLMLNGRWEDHVLTSLTNPSWQPR